MNQAELNDKALIAVKTYNVELASEVASKAIADKSIDLADLIENGFSKGMVEVGDAFNNKKIFLPHVMTAAKAMTTGIDIITPELELRGGEIGEGLGTVVICTIEGDIHSIGKDIVAIMLKVAGFNVINMGRDIPVDEIVAKTKEVKPRFVATSALMTATMVGQDILETKLKEAGVRDKVLTNVGGAPTSQAWADKIGADIFTENATIAVKKFIAAVKD
jgi:trimethylamine corrinoid protein